MKDAAKSAHKIARTKENKARRAAKRAKHLLKAKLRHERNSQKIKT